MKTRIIVDSTTDLLAQVKARVHIVPLTVHFGSEEYLDGVTIDHETFYQKLVETMQAMLYDNVSVQQIAEHNAISATTMKELFRKYAGISPKRYYGDMRGVEAIRMLESGMEIAEITEKLNYSSPNYFSFSFKKQFGLPPGQYRKQHLENKSST